MRCRAEEVLADLDDASCRSGSSEAVAAEEAVAEAVAAEAVEVAVAVAAARPSGDR